MGPPEVATLCALLPRRWARGADDGFYRPTLF
jgi:hypothetical protein